MEYNLTNWLRTNTGLDIKVNGRPVNETGDSIILNAKGGPVAARELRNDYAVQVQVKNSDPVDAKQNIDIVYNEMLNRYCMTLPEVTVKGKVYAEVTVAQMSPMQSPAYIGTDENGLHLWTVNFRIIV